MNAFPPFARVLIAVAVLAGVSSAPRMGALAAVSLVRLPDGAIQPQVVTDAGGAAHVLYFKGEPARGDLFYSRLTPQGTFERPMQVNTQPGAAIATGTIRGGHLALGRNGRVHVAWNGSAAAPKIGESSPVLYTRMNDAGTAFEAERNVVRQAVGLDGSVITADASGHVFVAWHAGTPETKGEEGRRLWVARSMDDGRTFAAETAASDPRAGACGCCGVGALADRRGGLFVLYRSAQDVMHRDTHLLMSRDNGRTFTDRKLQGWDIAACPMSSFALASATSGVLAAWETDGQVYWTRLDPATGAPAAIVAAPGAPNTRKHPVIAVNTQGEVLLVWTEGTGWSKGGGLAWQLFDRNGVATGVTGRAPGIPVWSQAAVAAGAGGGFTIVY